MSSSGGSEDHTRNNIIVSWELEVSSFSQLGRVKEGCLMVFEMIRDMMEDNSIQAAHELVPLFVCVFIAI